MEQSILITHYYHSGFSVACGQTLAVFDYWRGERGELTPELQLTPEKLRAYDKVFVFISHEHIDHLDPVVFTWNEDRFGDPDAFFKKMREKGAEVVPNVKPGVLLSHPYFERYENAFVKSGEDEKKPGVVPWWGGKGALWDFTDPEARKLWKDELKEKLIRHGTDSVWNDNCEYDSLACTDAVCSNEGDPAPAAGLRALMANLMCRAGFEAVIEENENARPYMVCRSGAPGIQKYAQTWCGDNFTALRPAERGRRYRGLRGASAR